jgi:CBS domain-containing protein
MKVYEAMTPDVVSVPPEASIQEAAQLMRQLDIGPLPVCDDGRLVGMLTDRDITLRATAEGRDPHQTPVIDVMTPEVICCFENDEVEQAALLMQEAQLRRLVVINEERKPVGVVSLSDIVLQTGDRRLAGRTLEGISDSPDR